LGVKGLVYMQLEVESLGQDAHSGQAASLPSAAWRLVQALATFRDAEAKIVIPGFYDDVLAPTPAQLEALANQTDMEPMMKEIYQIDAFVDDLTGVALRERQAFSPTCNIAGLWSGYQGEGVKTVLPARAGCKIDCRLVPNQDPFDIRDKIRAHLDAAGFTDVKLKTLGGSAPVVTPIEHPFVQRLIALSASFEGTEPSITPILGGTLPFLADLKKHVGVPGLCAPGNAGYWGSGAHAPNEHVRLSDLPRAVRFNCHMFLGLGE
jgi:acetylornithine deacetylase/succinyl-diaminopimelate desuccinylase-like protein